MELEIKEKLLKTNKKWRTRVVQQNKDWLSLLEDRYPGVSLKEQIYLFLHNMSDRPICAVSSCSNYVVFKDTWYPETCSYNCSNTLRKENGKLEGIQEKIRKTNQKRYGVDNPSQSVEVIEKRKSTNIMKYGDPAGALNTEENRERSRHRLADPIIQNKIKKSLKERYNVDNISQIPEIKERKRKKILKKYGVENVSQIHISSNSLKVLHDSDLLADFLKSKSISESSRLLGIGSSTLYRKIKEYRLDIVKERSSYEVEISYWLDSCNISYVRNSKSIIYPQELDFYFPDYQVAIEFNGLSHHSEFLGSSIRKVESSTFRSYHYDKWKQCNEKGIQLISIFEDEWNNKKEIVKKRILNILGMNKLNSVGARKLSLQSSTNRKKVYDFLEKYHWQGGIRNFHIGYEAWLNDVLVGVVTFSKRKNREYELTRYCVDDRIYPGLFGRFVSRFINDYNPTQIITFSDNRYATGGVYEKNGFKESSELREGYYITDYKNKWHKSNFRKNIIKRRFGLDIQGKTELELVMELNLDRIWDCGKKRWILTR